MTDVCFLPYTFYDNYRFYGKNLHYKGGNIWICFKRKVLDIQSFIVNQYFLITEQYFHNTSAFIFNIYIIKYCTLPPGVGFILSKYINRSNIKWRGYVILETNVCQRIWWTIGFCLWKHFMPEKDLFMASRCGI